MQQIHKRFTTEQVKALLQQYDQGHMTRKEVEDRLDIGKTRFFALLGDYRQDASAFSVTCERAAHSRLPQVTEDALERKLREEKALVDDKRLPLSTGCKIVSCVPAPVRRSLASMMDAVFCVTRLTVTTTGVSIPRPRRFHADTVDKLKFRWQVAGGKDFPFASEAVAANYNASRGVPRSQVIIAHFEINKDRSFLVRKFVRR